MTLSGTAEDIQNYFMKSCPEAFGAIKVARESILSGKRKSEILPYQAAVLYSLARSYNFRGARCLEIGTYYGFSAAVLAQAAPLATIETLNPLPWEVDTARNNLQSFRNVYILCRASWEYLEAYHGSPLDLIFVDGDHKQVRRDLPWWNWLSVGGLFLFHDFSPNGSTRACPPVYRALTDFSKWLGREFDVLVVDNQQIGMAGFYKGVDDPSWRM